MQGLGNDFVVIEALRQAVLLTPNTVRQLANRHFGIGCDQVLLIEAPTELAYDFRYRIFNQDGTEVEQCGNGARCIARFIQQQGLSHKTRLSLETSQRPLTVELLSDGQVCVDMGIPDFDPATLPFHTEHEAPLYPVNIAGQNYSLAVLSMGNPHAVLIVDDVACAPVEQLGQALQQHESFPHQVNLSFLALKSPKQVALRVYERGVGETLACGSAACAAVVAGIELGRLDHKVTVQTAGGCLTVQWAGRPQSVFLTGPAVTVFTGDIEI